MRVPISYALTYPERAATPVPPLELRTLEFHEPDLETFRMLPLAREAGVRGGTYPCAYNAANEVAVQAFLEGRIGFLDIAAAVEDVLDRVDGSPARDLAELVEADRRARELVPVAMSFGAAILGLAFLILIHEAGHFFAARAVGMRPRKFYIGFPPAVIKRVRGGVEYGIGAIPLGGYVKIPGMHRAAPGDLRGSLKPEEQAAHAAELDRLDAALEADDEPAARAVLAELEPSLGGQPDVPGDRRSALDGRLLAAGHVEAGGRDRGRSGRERRRRAHLLHGRLHVDGPDPQRLRGREGLPGCRCRDQGGRRRRLDRGPPGHRRHPREEHLGDGRPPVPDRVDRNGHIVDDRPSAREERPGHLPHRHPDQGQDGPRLVASLRGAEVGPSDLGAHLGHVHRHRPPLLRPGDAPDLELGRHRPRHGRRLPPVAPGLLLLPRLHQPRARAPEPAADPAARRRAHRDVDPRAHPGPRVLAARLPALQRDRHSRSSCSCSTSACGTICSRAAASISSWRASARST